MSQTTQISAARHARTRSDRRTSVDATNSSPRRRVLLTRSVQKDAGIAGLAVSFNIAWECLLSVAQLGAVESILQIAF